MEQPLVTVLVTTYNQERYIRQALDSVLAQRTDFPFEVLVSEDAGTDGTRAILQEYAARDSRIRLRLRDKNVGISRNWYEGLCAAKGEFVCTLAPVDHKSHLKAFFNLLSMLTKPELTVFQELRDAQTPEEAASALETAEYQIIQ